MCSNPELDGAHPNNIQYMQPLTDQYKLALKAKSEQLLRRFHDRAISNPEGCRAEAFMHWFLSECGVKAEIYEHTKEGGPDFICESAGQEFLFEVTSLSTDAVARDTGIPNMYERGCSFSAISRKLCEKVISKVPQLAKRGKPAVLAITTEHSLGSALMDETAAQALLTGKIYFSVVIGEPKRPPSVKTALEDSVWYSLAYDKRVDHCRRDISAILLVHIPGSGLRAIGALCPAPTFPFSVQALPSVLFFSVSHQPNAESPVIRIERNTPREPEYMRFPNYDDRL